MKSSTPSCNRERELIRQKIITGLIISTYCSGEVSEDLLVPESENGK